MTWAYDVAAAPAAYATISTTKRGNVFIDGETPAFTFNKNVTGTYTVRDYYGTTVSTGSLTAQASITPTAPGGGWKRGWYRLYLTGSVDNTGYGFSLGATNFCLVADDARFTPRPAASYVNFPADFQAEAPELPLKGWLGMGTSRLQIADAANPTANNYDNIASVQQALTTSHTYWSTGASHLGPDAVRPRQPYVSFPNPATDSVTVPADYPNDRLRFQWRSGTTAVARGELWVTVTAATTSGVKFTLMWPGSDTQPGGVDVIDNVTNTVQATVAAFASHPDIAVYRSNDRSNLDTLSTAAAVVTFREDFTGGTVASWSAAGGSTVTIAAAGTGHFTSYALNVALPTASAGVNPGAQRTAALSVTSGQIVRASAWLASPVSGKTLAISVSGPTFTGVTQTTVVSNGAWQRVTWTGTATSTTTATVLAYTSSATTAGQVLNVDDVQVMASAGLRVLESKKFLGVKQVVATCYPLGVTWYEGPENEPDMRKNISRYAAETILFSQAVKAGNPNAKVMGPSFVAIGSHTTEDYQGSTNQSNAGFDSVYQWATGINVPTDGPMAAAATYIDGFTTHTYNFCNGDMNIGRRSIEHLEHALRESGLDSLPRWQGEQGVLTPVYGVYHPRRARWQMLWDFLLDQAGMPRERNTVWYDESHGFWAFPAWWMNGNKGLNPQAVMIRVWMEEVYGHAYEGRLMFGNGIGEHIFTGNIYVSPSGTRRIGYLATSHLDNSTVTLQLEGTIPSSITWRTAFGVTSTTTPNADGRITLPVLGEPTWVELPAGTTATVQGFLGLNNIDIPNVAGFNANAVIDGIRGSRKAVDNGWSRVYDGVEMEQVDTVPCNLSILFDTTVQVSHVVIFSGMAWSGQAALVDFDIQTTVNSGGAWTTRQTVTKTATSIKHGTSSEDTGCQRETYWDEQWVFPVKLTTPVDCNGIRIVVRATSYGGEPDAASLAVGGQGWSQRLTLSEVAVLSDDVPRIASL